MHKVDEDLIYRLQFEADENPNGPRELLMEAADEIERLREENRILTEDSDILYGCSLPKKQR